MKRMTRKEIQEGLKQIPIEQILLGRVDSPRAKLTPKQIKFAEQIALGHSKAEAYRRSRDTKAKPITASRRGQDLMKKGAIVAQVEEFKLALEAERLRTPAQIRAFTIHKLTQGVLDPDMPPAQKVKCLELLGKITEVALFTERRETVTINRSEDIKGRLLSVIRTAIKSNAQDVDTSGDELLAELTAPIDDIGDPEPHPVATPLIDFESPSAVKHTNPHNESSLEAAHQPIDLEDDNSRAKLVVNLSPVSPDTGEKSL